MKKVLVSWNNNSQKRSDLNKKNEEEDELFEFEIPKFVDLTENFEIERDPFDNKIIERNLDDLWFTIGHYYHEESPQKNKSHHLTLSHKNNRASKSNKKSEKNKSPLNEHDEISEILSYINRMKIKNNQSLQSNERKTLKISQTQPKKIEKENKPLNKNSHIHIIEKKNLKRRPPTPPQLHSKENNLKKKPEKNMFSTKKMIDLNFKKQGISHNKSFNVVNERKNLDSKINQSTILNQSKERGVLKTNLQSDINHKENISYVPAYHSTRDIRKWEKQSGKKWYCLAMKERLIAIQEIDAILDAEKKKIINS